jgi:hypothetical protein
VFVIDVLEPRILLDGTGVGKIDRIGLLHKSIDKPVPVECGLDDDPCQLCLVGGKEGQDRLPVVRNIALEDPLSLFINDREVTTLCMKINSAVQSHGAPPD